jgi:uncharacterized protein (UPF0147 family)
MAQMTVKVEATGLEKVKKIFQVVKDVVDDERIPTIVREGIMDKVKWIRLIPS